MPRTPIPRPRFDAETIRACGELLRCVDESRSLRGNALAGRISPPLDHRDVVRIVRSTFDELTLRQRTGFLSVKST